MNENDIFGPAVEVDVRGLVCPEPVVRTRRALESVLPGGTVTVTTDSPESRDNIVRFAERAGCRATVAEPEPDVYTVHMTKTSEPGPVCVRPGAAILVSSDRLGRGDDELGRLLLTLFLRTLAQLPSRPAVLALMNGGVKLALADSETLAPLQAVANQGVKVMVCGTCLDFFGVKDQVRVGTVSNMYELAEVLLASDRLMVL
jgi:selenium metabolism protein YedF